MEEASAKNRNLFDAFENSPGEECKSQAQKERNLFEFLETSTDLVQAKSDGEVSDMGNSTSHANTIHEKEIEQKDTSEEIQVSKESPLGEGPDKVKESDLRETAKGVDKEIASSSDGGSMEICNVNGDEGQPQKEANQTKEQNTIPAEQEKEEAGDVSDKYKLSSAVDSGANDVEVENAGNQKLHGEGNPLHSEKKTNNDAEGVSESNHTNGTNELSVKERAEGESSMLDETDGTTKEPQAVGDSMVSSEILALPLKVPEPPRKLESSSNEASSTPKAATSPEKTDLKQTHSVTESKVTSEESCTDDESQGLVIDLTEVDQPKMPENESSKIPLTTQTSEGFSTDKEEEDTISCDMNEAGQNKKDDTKQDEKKDQESCGNAKDVEEIEKLLLEYCKSSTDTASRVDVTEGGNIAITLKMHSKKPNSDDNGKDYGREAEKKFEKSVKEKQMERKISTEESWSEVGQKRCPYCIFTTDEEGLFNSHISTCGKKREKREEILLKYKDGRFGCQNCLLAVTVKKKFEEHVAFHLLQEPYICLSCVVTFDCKKKIETHVREKHATETVKCGLRGSKKITNIIEILQNDGEYKFVGRVLTERHASRTQGENIEKKNDPTFSKNEKTILSVPVIPSSARVPTSTSITTSVTGAAPCSASLLPTTVTSMKPIPIKKSEAKALPTNQIPPMSSSVPSVGNIIRPSSGVLSTIPTVVQSALSTSQIRPPSIVSILPANQLSATTCTAVPIFRPTQSILAQSVATTAFQPSVVSRSVAPVQQNQSQTPVLLLSSGNILVPLSNIVSTRPSATTFAFQPGQTVGSVNQTGVVTVQPSQILAKPIYNAIPKSQSSTLPLKSAFPVDSASKMNPPLPIVSGVSNTVPLESTHIGNSHLSVRPNSRILNTPDATMPDTQKKTSRQMHFKKCGEIYACSFCTFEIKDKLSFADHVWNHFHVNPKICKDCTSFSAQNKKCELVRKVMKGLDSAAEIATKEKLHKDATLGKDVKTSREILQAGEIVISDEESGDRVGKDSDEDNHVKECNTSCESGDGVANIKILSTYSLSAGASLKRKNQDREEASAASNEKQVKSPEMGLEDPLKDHKEDDIAKTAESGLPLSGTNSDCSSEKSKTEVSKAMHGAEEKSLNLSRAIEDMIDKTYDESENNEATTNSNVTSLLVEQEAKSEQTSKSDMKGKNDIDSKEQSTRVVLDKCVHIPEKNKEQLVNTSKYFYQCGFDECGFAANTSNEYRDHLGAMHPFASVYKCVHCGQKSLTDELHMRHISGHSKQTSSVLFLCGEGCKFGTNILGTFRDHLQIVHPTLLDYKCASCKEIFSELDDLILHLETNKLQFVLCPHCTFKDRNRRVVMKHLADSHPGKPRQITVTAQLVCQERGINAYVAPTVIPATVANVQVTPEREAATNNINCAEKDATHVVPNNSSVSENTTCKDSKPEENDHEKSQVSNHASEESEVEDSPPRDIISETTKSSNTEVNNSSYLQCPKCSYLTQGKGMLAKHVAGHSRPSDLNRVLSCPECSTGSDNLALFSAHMRHHEGYHKVKVYTCLHCSYVTNQKDKIKCHGMRKHNSCVAEVDYSAQTHKYRETAYHCSKCDFIHKNQSVYHEHKLYHHGNGDGEEKEKCLDEKQGKYVEKTDHKKEVKETDEEDRFNKAQEKKFVCFQCKRGFDRLPQLKQHMNIHILENDYIRLNRCGYCAYTSTSDTLVHKHSREKHPRLDIQVKIRKEFIQAHSVSDESTNDGSSLIDLLHCDCCSFSCSDVQQLAQHTKVHLAQSGASALPAKPAKEKKPYTGPRKKFYVPSGNIFKENVECSECKFVTKRRLDLLRHIKGHPNLEPVLQTSEMKDRAASQKSSKSFFQIRLGKRKRSSDTTEERKKRQRTETLSEDDTDDEEWEPPLSESSKKKQVAVKSTTSAFKGSKLSSALYYLGGDVLHLKLRPCFRKDELEPMFECLFCKDVFEEKYSLHRHILQHMNVCFFKCSYCEHGELETSALVTHIQKEHRKPVRHQQIDPVEIESKINEAIHNMKAQEYWGAPETVSVEASGEGVKREEEVSEETSETAVDMHKNQTEDSTSSETFQMRDIKKEAEELHDESLSITQYDFPVSSVNKALSDGRSPRMGPLPQCIVMMGRFYKCIVCNHRTDNRTSILKHAMTHCTRKRHMCPACTYRSHFKGDVKKHMTMLHPGVNESLYDYEDLDADAQYILNVDSLKEEQKAQAEQIPETNELPIRNQLNQKRRYKCLYCDYKSNWSGDVKRHNFRRHKGMPFRTTRVESSDHKTDDLSSSRGVKRRASESAVDENDSGRKIQTMVGMKSFYKCLLCSQTFKSRQKIFLHLRTTRCKRNLWRCSVCIKFKSDKEKVVSDHIKDNHANNPEGKPSLCAQKGKIRIHKVPVNVFRTPSSSSNNMTEEKSAQEKESGPKEIKKNAEKQINATQVKFTGDRWACVKCNYKSFSKHNVVRHMVTHNDVKKYICPLCSYRARMETTVKKHMSVCHPGEDKTVVISEENLGGKDSQKKVESDQAASRKASDNVQRYYKCLECGRLLNSISGLYKHLRLKCKTPMIGCSECHYKSLNEAAVKSHIKQSHPQAKCEALKTAAKMKVIKISKMTEDEDMETKEKMMMSKAKLKPLKLKIEADSISYKTKETTSREPPQKLTACPACNFPVVSCKAMCVHFSTVHQGHRVFCLYCEQYVTKKVSQLVKHTRLFHGKDNFSELRFDILSENDVRNKELDERPVFLYKCGFCEHTAQRQPMKFHLYIHFKYRPYKCKYCDARFKSVKVLQHIRKVHPGKKEEYVYDKDDKKEKQIKSMLEKGRHQTLSKKTYKLNESFKRSTAGEEKKAATEELEDDDDGEAAREAKFTEVDKERKKTTSGRGDLKNIFSPCHNYTVDYDIKAETNVYQCSICPYKTTSGVKTITNHFYYHVPHIFKCPYCSFQNYPRSKVVCHLKSQHPGKTIHVVDLRNKVKDLKFREYEPETGKEFEKTPKVTPIKMRNILKKVSKDKSSSGKKRTLGGIQLSKSLADVFTSEESDNDDNNSVQTDGSRNGRLSYRCSMCTKVVESLYHYRQHLASHGGFKYQVPGSQIESRLKCGYCAYLALDDNDFKKHMQDHFNARPYSCPYCNFSQYRPSGIKRHITKAHPNKPVDVIKDNTASCLIAENASERRVMLVKMDPKVCLGDILAMDAQDFEDLLTKNGVSVIDLNFILDEKFESVSKTLGLHEELIERGEECGSPKSQNHETEDDDNKEQPSVSSDSENKQGAEMETDTKLEDLNIKVEKVESSSDGEDYNLKYEDISEEEEEVKSSKEQPQYEDISDNDDI